jgi:hypothetical protein
LFLSELPHSGAEPPWQSAVGQIGRTLFLAQQILDGSTIRLYRAPRQVAFNEATPLSVTFPPGSISSPAKLRGNRPGGGDYLAQWACERIAVHKGQMVNLRVTHNPQHENSPINNIFTVE